MSSALRRRGPNGRGAPFVAAVSRSRQGVRPRCVFRFFRRSERNRETRDPFFRLAPIRILRRTAQLVLCAFHLDLLTGDLPNHGKAKESNLCCGKPRICAFPATIPAYASALPRAPRRHVIRPRWSRYVVIIWQKNTKITEKKLRDQRIPQLFCFFRRSFSCVRKFSGASTRIIGPKERIRINTSVSSSLS